MVPMTHEHDKPGECPACRKKTLVRKPSGMYQCDDAGCGAIAWKQLEKIEQGNHLKDFKCFNCNFPGVHQLGQAFGAVVLRCSVCGTHFVGHT